MKIYPGDLLSWHDIADINFHLYESDISDRTNHVLRYLYTIFNKKFTFYYTLEEHNNWSSFTSFDVFYLSA